MAEYNTDEERIEAIKIWWSAYWKQTTLSLVLLLSGYLGWQYFDYKDLQASQLASEQFSEILDSWPDQIGDDIKNPQRDTIIQVAEKLRNNNAGSAYAWLSSLALARLAVEQGDLESASAELRLVLESDLAEIDEQSIGFEG